MLQESVRPSKSAVLDYLEGPVVVGPTSPVLALRLGALTALFLIELIGISIWLDTASLVRTTGLTGFVGDWGPRILRGLVAFTVAFLAMGYSNARPALARISQKITHVPIAWSLLASHLLAALAFGALSQYLFHTNLSGLGADFIAAAWIATGALGALLATFALVPIGIWLDFIGGTGKLWISALAVAVSSVAIGSAATRLWGPTTELTFRLVTAMLRPILPNLIVDPAAHRLATPNFDVEISQQCSGLEGAGLMLVFGVAWLWFFRKEFRFPRALLLVPAGVLVLWLANSFRIAALMLIGNAGAPAVATGGFHSEAGWIAFNVVALGLSIATRRLSWFRRDGVVVSLDAVRRDNPVAAYLMPFLVILAAGMLSRAASGGFEWFYPVRFIAAAAVLWSFRSTYRQLDWRFGWTGPLVGVLVFALWMGLDRLNPVRDNQPIALGLASLSVSVRVVWLVFRTLAAVVTVPIAEELAFRGFLIRRIVSPDFDSIDPKYFTWLALFASSLAFGLMHGDRWIAGTVAGLLYAAAFLRRGRIAEAVIAHATTNALLAAWVISGANWYLW